MPQPEPNPDPKKLVIHRPAARPQPPSVFERYAAYERDWNTITDAKRAAGRRNFDEIRTITNFMLQRNSQLREIIANAAQQALQLIDVHTAQIRAIERQAQGVRDTLVPPKQPIEKVRELGY